MRESFEYFVERMIPEFDGAMVNEILGDINWSAWIYRASLAPEPLHFNTVQSDLAAHLAHEYIKLNGTESPRNFSAYSTFYSNLKVVFHDTLASQIDRVNIQILERIDADLDVTNDVDPEVR